MAVDLLNEIIFIFIQRNVCELSDNDLSIALKTNGKDCSIEEIHRVVQSLGSSLFQLWDNDNWTSFIRVEPTVSSFSHFFYC